MNNPVRIYVDWGGTIVIDYELYETIARKSHNNNIQWQSPDSWDNVASIGNNNHFQMMENRFFETGNPYSGAIDVISSFCGNDGQSSESQIFVTYDNNPNIISGNIIKKMAFAFKKMGGKANGFYVESDKLLLAKRDKVDIFVEDDPRIAMTLANAGVHVILLLRYWNRMFSPNRLIISKEKLPKILSNLHWAEDWYQAGIILGNLVDSIRI